MQRKLALLLLTAIFVAMTFAARTQQPTTPQPETAQDSPAHTEKKRDGIWDSWPIVEVESDVRADSLSASRLGDLHQLVHNIYVSFLLYKRGETRLTGSEHPVVIGPEKVGSRPRTYYIDALKNIPAEAAESIEVTDDPVSVVLFGFRGAACVIRIALKDPALYEASTF